MLFTLPFPLALIHSFYYLLNIICTFNSESMGVQLRCNLIGSFRVYFRHSARGFRWGFCAQLTGYYQLSSTFPWITAGPTRCDTHIVHVRSTSSLRYLLTLWFNEWIRWKSQSVSCVTGVAEQQRPGIEFFFPVLNEFAIAFPLADFAVGQNGQARPVRIRGPVRIIEKPDNNNTTDIPLPALVMEKTRLVPGTAAFFGCWGRAPGFYADVPSG